MKEAILITSIGAKVPLIKTVTRAKDSFDSSLTILGADTNPKVLGRYFVDVFWQMPHLEELTLEALLEYAKKYDVRYIIPTRDEELIFFAHHKRALKQERIDVFVADEVVVQFCYDKLHFYENAKNLWAIPTSLSINELQADTFVVKERFGAGAKNMACNVTKAEALTHAKKLQEPIFQPFIEGREYSIDCYIDKTMTCIGVVVRSRDVVIDGESKVTTIVHNDVLAQKAAEFATYHKIQGHSVLQVLQNKSGSYLIECNARFGGASTLSEHAGLQSFLWFLLEANKKSFEVSITSKTVRQVRVNKDYYFED